MQRPTTQLLYRSMLAITLACLCLAGDQKREFFPISRMPKNFRQPAQALSALVFRHGKTINHFCVVGLRYGKGEHDYHAYVYWKENNTITLWDGGATPEESTYTLLYSLRTWDLDRDVVPADMDFGGTSTLQDKEVDEILSACKRVGQQFVIRMPSMEPGFHKF